MPSLTLKGIPEEIMTRLRRRAEAERRSLNQQAIRLLEEALADVRPGFMDLYASFLAQEGPSPLEGDEVDGLRSLEEGRPSPFATGDGA